MHVVLTGKHKKKNAIITQVECKGITRNVIARSQDSFNQGNHCPQIALLNHFYVLFPRTAVGKQDVRWAPNTTTRQ